MPKKSSGTSGGENLPHLQGMGRRERRAAETRLRLFRCALELFAKRGLSNVTVEDITEAADVGKGTFFNYFQSKDHVLGVITEIQLGKVREALELAQTGKHSIHGVMRHLFARVTEEPGRSPELTRALLSSFLANEVVRQQLAQNMLAGRQMVAEIVAIGQIRGEIDPKLRKEQVALMVQQTLIGTMLLWSLRGEPSLQSTIEQSFQHFWRAVGITNRECAS